MASRKSRRRSLAVLCTVPVALVAAGLLTVFREELPTWVPGSAAPEEHTSTGEVPLLDMTPLDPVQGDRAHAATSDDGFLLADGTRLPAGTRRTSARRIVTPDGRVFERRRGEDHWTPVDDGAAPGTEAGAGDPSPTPGAQDRQKAIEEFYRRFREQHAGTVAAGNVRAAPLPGETAPTATVASNWKPAKETIVSAGSEAPRIGRTRRPEGTRRRASRAEENVVPDVEVVEQHGLRADYYDFLHGQLVDIPDLTTLPPSHTRIDMTIDFAKDEAFKLPFEPETFATLWRGQLVVPASGSYTFTCGSDDGMRLRIGGATVLEHTGLRAYGESAGTVQLDAGRHDFELVFYENLIFASCRLFWEGPGVARQIVPATAFVPPSDVAQIIQPALARIEPAAARAGDTVTLHGVGFSTSPVLNRVTFGGVEAEITGATATTLDVVVPVGASTGDVIAQVGPLSSLPRRFEVTSISGLFAEYFHIGADLNTMPDMDALTPYFVRLEGPFDFHQDHLWNLPYDPDVYALRATGFLYIPVEDDYRITMGSDDGTLLRIGGRDFLKDPGLHAYHEVETTARFTKGFHPIELQFFENRGVARLRLFWQRATDVERSIIPKGFFFPPDAVMDRPNPTVRTIEPAGAGIGERITVAGAGFGDSVRYARVHFGGDVWARPESVTDDQLTVVVPYGAETGELRVEAGISLSAARHFTVTSQQGLTARYYRFGSADEVRQNASPEKLAALSPALTRIDTSFQFETAADWKLAFPAQNFAVHWSGTLGVPYPTTRLWILQMLGGGWLHIDGKRVVDLGPFHAMAERSGAGHLAPGAHRIDLWYFVADGVPQMKLLWAPHGKHEHRDVPARWFQPTE